MRRSWSCHRRGRQRAPGAAQRLPSACADALAECDYLDRGDLAFDRPFHVASSGGVADALRGMAARPGPDARCTWPAPCSICARSTAEMALWHDVERTVVGAVDRDLLQVLANDCLASLPPLTFFQDAVVDESGEQTTVFRLEHSALRPLVDVGRVFGMAADRVLGTSTLERFACARTRAARARVDLPRSIRNPAHPALAAGAHRHRPGHQRIGAAAGAAQPPRPARPEERLPLHPAAARVHRQLALARDAYDGRRASSSATAACFDTTWTDETPIEQVRFVVLDLGDHRTQSAHRSHHHDWRRRGLRARDPAGGLLRRAAEGRGEHERGDGARHHPRRGPRRAGRGGGAGALARLPGGRRDRRPPHRSRHRHARRRLRARLGLPHHESKPRHDGSHAAPRAGRRLRRPAADPPVSRWTRCATCSA